MDMLTHAKLVLAFASTARIIQLAITAKHALRDSTETQELAWTSNAGLVLVQDPWDLIILTRTDVLWTFRLKMLFASAKRDMQVSNLHLYLPMPYLIYSVLSGTRCDVCSDNYYGNPEVPGGLCAPCDCNEKIDLLQPGNCDPHTGNCLKCLKETTGDHCEVCRDGFFRFAEDLPCQGNAFRMSIDCK